MDATEFGAYMSLIITCYQSHNSLLDDDARLARMARVTLKVWRRIKPTIADKFLIIDGKWSHDVVRRELLKYSSLSTKNKANALKKNNSPKPVASQPHSQNGANTSNNNQITNNKPPLVPPRGGVEVFKMEKVITPQCTEAARQAAPQWDINHLMAIYDEGINSGKRPPPNQPNSAFPGWCQAYTSGNPP